MGFWEIGDVAVRLLHLLLVLIEGFGGNACRKPGLSPGFLQIAHVEILFCQIGRGRKECLAINGYY